MNNSILLIFSLATCWGCCIVLNYITQEYENSAAARHIFNVFTSMIAALTIFAISGNLKASFFTVALAIAFGLTTALQRVMHLQALEMGPFAYTSVIVSLSMLIPTLSGAVIWGEHIYPIQVIGIVLMVGCLILSVDFAGEQKKSSLKWFLFCGLAFLGNGAIGIMQKLHQNTVYKEELNQFLVIAFITSSCFSGIMIALSKKTEKDKATETDEPKKKKLLTLKPIIIMIIGGLCIGISNVLNLYLSGAMDSAVFFPVVNGGCLILTTLSALFMFKEKLSTKRWIGIILGIVSVILLCNPFA